MKKILKSIKCVWCALLMLPTWLLVSIKQNPRLKEDFAQWCKWKRVPHNAWGIMQLCAEYQEFRSLIYYRLGKGGYLIDWLLAGQKCLYIYTSNIGGGLLLQHAFSTIITANKIGNNCKIMQQVTIGFNGDMKPILGDNVIVCSGAKIIGGVTIGNNVIVGANAVVVHDVPDNSIVGGVPAKIIRRLDKMVDVTE